MGKMKQVIYSRDWLAMHPYQSSARTDFYYTTLANKACESISNRMGGIYEEDVLYLSSEERKELSCMLLCYFEDIISQAGMFAALVRIHEERFGTPLPFFRITEDYVKGEINKEDLQFLIWHYYMQLNNLDFPFSPLTPLFSDMAEDVMALLEPEYETAPENDKLQAFFHVDDKEASDIYALHSKFFWLGTESYLFCGDGLLLQDSVEELAEEAKSNGMEEQLPDLVNMSCNDFAYNNITEFFSFSAPRWLAEILGKEHVAYKGLTSLGKKYSGYFLYEREENDYTYFRHIATGTELEVNKLSLKGFPKEMKSEDVILFAGFIRWSAGWWFVGQVRSYEKNEELLDEISGNEDEYNLFEPEAELPEEEQEIILNDVLADLGEGDDAISEEDAAWQAVLNDEIGKEYFLKRYESGDIPALNFFNDENNLMQDNIRFILDYVKR
ncbi:DUF3843 family protein [Barnesiella propionica]|uniref:DUF3843 family protein n=1 Tax=Barnesiella propionica TaxID=2981781 RepID=UPI0011C73002|nr:DUF3843 family protein [Barnesiella propionica]MCU6769434.1 DUF3843 family protein [Barnesiella propionica]